MRASNELIAVSLALRSNLAVSGGGRKRNISFVLIDAIVAIVSSLALSRCSRDTSRVASRESRNGGSTEPGCRCARLPIAAERKHPVSRLDYENIGRRVPGCRASRAGNDPALAVSPGDPHRDPLARSRPPAHDLVGLTILPII